MYDDNNFNEFLEWFIWSSMCNNDVWLLRFVCSLGMFNAATVQPSSADLICNLNEVINLIPDFTLISKVFKSSKAVKNAEDRDQICLNKANSTKSKLELKVSWISVVNLSPKPNTFFDNDDDNDDEDGFNFVSWLIDLLL